MGTISSPVERAKAALYRPLMTRRRNAGEQGAKAPIHATDGLNLIGIHYDDK
jgi:hypothetical protein